jgi:DNA-binding CsgD family transcriptional regulator/tetratricopeptide (TPR) repeat protein
MKLIERDSQLATLQELFIDCQQGRGRVAIITGPVASGKTALLHTFADRAVKSGAVFLTAAASQTEVGQPFGLIGQLFEGADLSVESARRVRRLLDESALSAMVPEPGMRPAELAAPVLRLLCQALLELADLGPLVIGVDDSQHADAASLQCLLYLARRLHSARVLLVLNDCAGAVQPNPLFHAELMRQPHCRLIRLELLSQTGVAGLLARLLQLRLARDLARAGYRVSGGNPLLARALLDDYQTYVKIPPAELVLGGAFSQAVVTCLYRCGPGMRDVAQAIAVLGSPESPALLSELLDLDVKTTVRAIHALNAAGLLDGGQFRHGAARAAVLDGMLAAERTSLHGRAARVLQDRGAAAIEVARHVIAADPVEAPWVVPVLREAATQALADDGVGLAIDCLRLAHQISANEPQRASIKSALASAEWRVNPSAAARHLPDLTAAARAGRLGWEHAGAPIAQLLWSGRVTEAVETLDVVVGLHGDLAPMDPDSTMDLDAARLWLGYGYPDLGIERSDPALARREDSALLRSPHLRAATSLATVLSQDADEGADEGAVAGAEWVLQGTRLDDATLAPITAALATLIYSNRLDRAALWLDPLLKEAGGRFAPTWHALLAAIRAAIDLRQGDLVAAESSARDALTAISPRCWGVGIGLPLSCMVLATTAQGRHQDAATYLKTPVPDAMFQTPFGLHYLQARGRHQLAVDRPRAALGDFLACGERMTRWGLDLPALVPWRTDAAQALLSLGRLAEAGELIEEELAGLVAGHRRPGGVALRLLAATCSGDRRLALLKESVELLQEQDDRYETALAIADLGAAYQAVGDHDQAAMAIRRATRLVERCGAVLPWNRPGPSGPDARPGGSVGGPAGPVVGAGAGGSGGADRAGLLGGPGGTAGRARPLIELSRVDAEPSDPGWFEPDRSESDPLAAEADGPPQLSDAELRVAALAAEGHSNREIANRLFITVSTVEQHLTRVYRKLKVRRRTDLPLASVFR